MVARRHTRTSTETHRRRTCAAAALLVGGVLLLVGCAQVELGSEYSEDGSATHSIVVVFERGALDAATASAVARRLAEAEAQARSDGFIVERIDSGEDIGLRVARTTDEAEDAGAALNSLLNSVANVLATGPVAPFHGTFNTQSSAVGGAEFTLELTVDGSVLADAIESIVAELGNSNSTSSDISQQLTVSYVAVMPGEVEETSGVLVNEQTVRWDLPLEGTTTLTAESGLAEQSSTAWFIVAAIASFAAVLIVAAAVGYVLLRRHRAGRMRLVLPTPDAASGEPAASGEQATGMADVGSSLARVVGRVVSGPPDTDGDESCPRTK